MSYAFAMDHGVPRKRNSGRTRYRVPDHIRTSTLRELLHRFGRSTGGSAQIDMLRSYSERDVFIYSAGDINLLAMPSVSIVGTRQISDAGTKRAHRLARELAASGVLVMSGLAKGVDTVAHTAAIDAGGNTAAVIGTPLDRAYPAENADLQEHIYLRHLLISPFNVGDQVYRSNFPERNKVMALLSDATVIVEASDTSGTLHQAVECQKNGRWLFIMRSVAEDPAVTWPARFLGHPKTRILNSTDEIIRAIGNGQN
jgi:DNA processing protein